MGGRRQRFLQARKCHLSLSHTHCHRKSEFLAHPSHNTLTQLVIQPPQISHVHTTFSTAAHRDNGWSVMSVQKYREAWGSTEGQGLETPILWPQLMHPYTSLPLSLALPPLPSLAFMRKTGLGTCIHVLSFNVTNSMLPRAWLAHPHLYVNVSQACISQMVKLNHYHQASIRTTTKKDNSIPPQHKDMNTHSFYSSLPLSLL